MSHHLTICGVPIDAAEMIKAIAEIKRAYVPRAEWKLIDDIDPVIADRALNRAERRRTAAKERKQRR